MQHLPHRIPRGVLCTTPRTATYRPDPPHCRLVRARALTSLGLVSEAAAVLGGLLAGSRLPDSILDTDLVPKNNDDTPMQASGTRFERAADCD